MKNLLFHRFAAEFRWVFFAACPQVWVVMAVFWLGVGWYDLFLGGCELFHGLLWMGVTFLLMDVGG